MELQSKELVSIIIPTYKNRGNLMRAIDSALDQDYQSIEVIVVDDNDPDSTFRRDTEVCMSHYDAEDRVIYLKHSENRNGAAARNTGIKQARGKYIAFLDDDDCFMPGKIKAQVEFLDDHNEFEGVYCQAIKSGQIIKRNLKDGSLARDLLLMKTYMFTPSLMFRREALKTIGGFDESFRRHQDYELLLKFFRAGFKIGVVQKPLIEIGANLGENALSGADYEKTKERFLKTFADDINLLDSESHGFKNKVFARHYSSVFLTYLKARQYKSAIRIFKTYFCKSPSSFSSLIFKSAVFHIIKR